MVLETSNEFWSTYIMEIVRGAENIFNVQ